MQNELKRKLRICIRMQISILYANTGIHYFCLFFFVFRKKELKRDEARVCEIEMNRDKRIRGVFQKKRTEIKERDKNGERKI